MGFDTIEINLVTRETECEYFVFVGFRDEYPGGGIYRHQFEQLTGNTVMNIVFK